LHRRTIEQDLWSAVLTRAALVVVTLFSVGNFQERIIPDGDTSNIQQYIVIAMWIVIAVVSFFRRKTLSIEPAPEWSRASRCIYRHRFRRLVA